MLVRSAMVLSSARAAQDGSSPFPGVGVSAAAPCALIAPGRQRLKRMAFYEEHAVPRSPREPCIRIWPRSPACRAFQVRRALQVVRPGRPPPHALGAGRSLQSSITWRSCGSTVMAARPAARISQPLLSPAAHALRPDPHIVKLRPCDPDSEGIFKTRNSLRRRGRSRSDDRTPPHAPVSRRCRRRQVSRTPKAPQ
jgi:hypothetical protein